MMKSIRDIENDTFWEIISKKAKAGKHMYSIKNGETGEICTVWADGPLKELGEITAYFRKDGKEYSPTRNLVSKLTPMYTLELFEQFISIKKGPLQAGTVQKKIIPTQHLPVARTQTSPFLNMLETGVRKLGQSYPTS
jgi:hypothetical protein